MTTEPRRATPWVVLVVGWAVAFLLAYWPLNAVPEQRTGFGFADERMACGRVYYETGDYRRADPKCYEAIDAQRRLVNTMFLGAPVVAILTGVALRRRGSKDADEQGGT
jgi:hypothetical protein